MVEHVIKLPDVGEGVAEAELVEWHVKVGDHVREDTMLAAVMTDKATVEIPSPVDGIVVWLGSEIGETVTVGSPIVTIEVAGGRASEAGASTAAERKVPTSAKEPDAAASGLTMREEPKSAHPSHASAPSRAGSADKPPVAALVGSGGKPLASPAVRLRARKAGVDLDKVPGSGPAGRITHADLDAFMARGGRPAPLAATRAEDTVEEIKIIGMRRRIAEKMSLSTSRIAHITYVEEVDVTALEELRAKLNAEKRDRPKLTILPFLMRAMVKAIADQPILNAHFDDEAGVVRRHDAIHMGIAAQTEAGLVVPVVRHAEARDLWNCAAEVNRLAEAAKAGTATREELTGSTITITSLGALGGIATTPVINHPEVAIVGVNRIAVRPMWDGSQFQPRKMMNLSSSFDHRIIDGWQAAIFVRRIKMLLETPAMIFIDG